MGRGIYFQETFLQKVSKYPIGSQCYQSHVEWCEKSVVAFSALIVMGGKETGISFACSVVQLDQDG